MSNFADFGSEQVCFVLIGAPGCGKGAAVKNMPPECQKFTMSVALEELKNNPIVGVIVRYLMDEGFMVPTEDAFPVFKKSWENFKNAKYLILDGVIRTELQARLFMEMLGEQKWPGILVIIHLNTPIDVCRARLLSKPEDRQGRPDGDRPEVLERRFRIYEATTLKVPDYFARQGLTIITINTDQPAEATRKELWEKTARYFKK